VSQNLREGSRVSYVGDGSDGRSLGERGQILAINGRSGHVKWADSSITLVDLEFDVAPLASTTGAVRAPARDELDDSLDVGPIHAVGMAGVYEREGGAGVLNALAGTGQLSSFASIAEEARFFVEQRVRQDPDFCRVTAQLDPDEADELISLASHVLLRDAFGVPGGD
jgi:hypothetical protein